MIFLNCRNLNSTINTKIISYHIIFKIHILKITQVPIVMQQEYSIVSININPWYAKRCIKYDLPRVVKDTSVEIIDKVHTHSLHGFSGYIRLNILQSYQQSCTIINCYIYSRN